MNRPTAPAGRSAEDASKERFAVLLEQLTRRSSDARPDGGIGQGADSEPDSYRMTYPQPYSVSPLDELLDLRPDQYDGAAARAQPSPAARRFLEAEPQRKPETSAPEVARGRSLRPAVAAEPKAAKSKLTPEAMQLSYEKALRLHGRRRLEEEADSAAAAGLKIPAPGFASAAPARTASGGPHPSGPAGPAAAMRSQRAKPSPPPVPRTNGTSTREPARVEPVNPFEPAAAAAGVAAPNAAASAESLRAPALPGSARSQTRDRSPSHDQDRIRSRSPEKSPVYAPGPGAKSWGPVLPGTGVAGAKPAAAGQRAVAPHGDGKPRARMGGTPSSTANPVAGPNREHPGMAHNLGPTVERRGKGAAERGVRASRTPNAARARGADLPGVSAAATANSSRKTIAEPPVAKKPEFALEPRSLQLERREQRQSTVSLRLNSDEFDTLRLRAAESGISVSAYMRSCVLEAEHLRAQVKQALAEMRASTVRMEAAQLPAVTGEPANPRQGGVWSRFLAKSATFLFGPWFGFRSRD